MSNEIAKSIQESEAIIKNNENFVGMGLWNIGNELKYIRDSKTYQQKGYDSFENYIVEELDYSRKNAYRYITVAESHSVSSMTQIGHIGIVKLLEVAKIPEQEREQFISEQHEINGQAKTIDEMTTREMQQLIKERKAAEERANKLAERVENDIKEYNEKLNQKDAEINRLRAESVPQVIEKEVAPSDYKQMKSQIDWYEQTIGIKNNYIEELKNKVESLERKENINKETIKQAEKIKQEIDALYKQKDDISVQLQSIRELATVSAKIDRMLKEDLAPIKYSRIFEQMHSETARENLLSILHNVESWCYEIKQMIPREYRNVEVL